MKKLGYLALIVLTLAISIMPAKALESTILLEGESATTYKKITCGEMEIPYAAPKIVSTLIIGLEIATPILIIIFGSIDLIKAVIAQKDDDIKKGWQTFIKRLLVGAIVFVTFLIVEFFIGLVAPHNENENMWDCVDCFVTGNCDNLMVGKTNND